jgi:hypothetical protein
MVATPAAAAGRQSVVYNLRPVAFLGDPAPGGGEFTIDFEPSVINDSGEVAFTAHIDTSGDEGVFVAKGGAISQLMRAGLPAPGGFTFGAGELGRLGVNDGGDVAAGCSLNPFDPAAPSGVPGGVFRFADSTGVLSPVEVPGAASPGGGTFVGSYFNEAINNRGDIIYPGLATGSAIVPGTPHNFNGMSLALFEQSKNGTNARLVGPGDAAPGGHVFDDAWNGSDNNRGDVVFSGHVVGDPCIFIGVPFACGDSLYLRDVGTGAITSIAHQGDPAPGGGTYTTAFGGLINNARQVEFLAATGPPASSPPVPFGVYRSADGQVTAVAVAGDPMPGGGALLSAGGSAGQSGLYCTGAVGEGESAD